MLETIYLTAVGQKPETTHIAAALHLYRYVDSTLANIPEICLPV